MEKIRIGLIGCGGMMKRHAEGMQLLEHVQITAVCDAIKEIKNMCCHEEGRVTDNGK